MAVQQRVITALIDGKKNLVHGQGAYFWVTSDTGAPSRSSVSGNRLNYEKKDSGGYLGDGILYSNMNIRGCNGGTSNKCWFQLYFDKTSDYDFATVGLPNGINAANTGGTSINLDKNDSPSDAFEALFTPLSIYNSFIYLKIMREDEKTSTNGVSLTEDAKITLYLGYNVDDPDPPPVPTNFKISTSSVRPSGTATLSWSGSNADYFKIDRKLNSGEWSLNTYTPEGTSQNVTAPSTAGNTYYYRIRAYGAGLNSSYNSTTLSLKAEQGQAASPSIAINGKTTLYVASPGSNKYTISWSTPSAGTNNSITGYTVQQSSDNSSFTNYGNQLANNATSTTVVANTANGASYYYRILPINQYGTCTSYSNVIQIKTISAPTAAKISTAPTSTNISADFDVSWNTISKGTGYTISYQLDYIVNGSATRVYTGTNTSATVSVASISNNSNFTLKLTTIATATDGGTISSSSTHSTTYTKGAAVSFNNRNLTIKNDAGTSGAVRAYNTVSLSWNAATTTDQASGTMKYRVRYKTSSMGEWDDLKDANNNKVEALTTTSYTVSNFGKIVNEGEEARFKVQAYQNTTQAAAETLEVTITRMEKPQITSGSIAGTITPTSIPYKFSYKYTIPSDDIVCTVDLGYNGTYGGVSQTHILTQTSGTVEGEDTKLTFSLVSGNTSSSAVIKALYTKVITNHYVKPDGTIRITLGSKTITACSTTYNIPFKYNFKTPITSGTFTAGYSQNKSFYNPGDIINLYCTKPNWTDAAGGTTGAESITYTYKGNNKENQTITAGTITTDLAPAASSDFSLVYTLTTVVKYADDSDTVEVDTNPVSIARWNDTDIAALSSVTKTGSTIKGFLILPELLCASGQHSNLQQVSYTLYNYQTKIAVSSETTLTAAEAYANRERSFTFTDTTEGDLSYYAIVNYKNTSGNIISKTTATYLLRSAGVPIAIRKGRVGINVGSANFIDNEDASKNSALYVAASSSANTSAPVVEVSGNSGVDNTLMKFTLGDSPVGIIKSRNQGALTITNLSTTSNISLVATGWTGSSVPYTYKIENSYITVDTFQEVLPNSSITTNQLKAYQQANIIGGNQGAGYCELKCYGAKPTITIPITLIVRGG